MYKLDLEKAEKQEIKLPTAIGSYTEQGNFRKKVYFFIFDYTKQFDCVDHNKLWNILKEMGMPDLLTCLLIDLYASQEVTVRTEHGTVTDLKLGKEYVTEVYCHPTYLTYIQSTLY